MNTSIPATNMHFLVFMVYTCSSASSMLKLVGYTREANIDHEEKQELKRQRKTLRRQKRKDRHALKNSAKSASAELEIFNLYQIDV
ncbi:unnamed protein product [Ambrosiozyma monospora]|uniref:Unnamed protein product n=1 Tax=Ambrosiozyma monospora TaxID=43982 RepID=A0A9W6T237_AMBMO|nr:unnamed protein product [Ambrosiozyma monospora]